MGRSLGATVLRLLVGGAVLLFVLTVLGTLLGLVVGILSALFTAVVLLGLVVLFGAVGAGLLSLFGEHDGDDSEGTDWFETDVAGADIADTHGDAASGDTASEAARLRQRYVAGEIDEVEFERRLDLLLDDPEHETLLDDDREISMAEDR